jgi:timeless
LDFGNGWTILTPSRLASSDASRQSNQLHQELIALFDKELVLEIFLVLGQDMEARENAQYNLLMMELLHHLLKTQDPAAVARSHLPHDSTSKKTSTLAAKLKQEQSHLRSIAGARHGHFGGTWMKQKRDGKTSFVAAAKNQSSNQGSTSATRKNRKAEPFIGSGKALLSYCRKEFTEDGPATQRAHESLHNFCQRFIKDCYGPVMKSLKNEFRRDSHRLEVGDKVVFFRIVWFFCQWWRLSRNTRKLGQLIFTMDVFTFNLVLTSTDTFHQHKNHARLAQAVALYGEMMHLLLDMLGSKDETESVMARGLLDRLFYGAEPLDRLPRLLNRWSPGSSTREYLCDLVELCHVCLKLLDMNQQECRTIAEKGIEERNDKVEKMRATAAQFDVKAYFCRKIVSNHLISMYTHLFGQYKVNSASVNHRILAMLLRITRTELVAPEIQETGVPINPLGCREVTLEPMLFNIHLVVTAGKILGDPSICNDQKDFRELIAFCTNFFNRVLSTSQKNPMLFVECLFRHPAPHRFCELFSNLYVSEELRMIAEREILLDEQRRYQDEFPLASGEQGEQDGDEAEHEFDDAIYQAATHSEGVTGSSDETPKVGPKVSNSFDSESDSDDFVEGNSSKRSIATTLEDEEAKPEKRLKVLDDVSLDGGDAS